MVNQRELTEEGIEKNFATKTLGMVYRVYLYAKTFAFQTSQHIHNLIQY